MKAATTLNVSLHLSILPFLPGWREGIRSGSKGILYAIDWVFAHKHNQNGLQVSDPDYIVTVERAQSGDASAFAELVTRFQDLAVGVAYGWFGEVETARDVAQESFLEAHRSLSQLQEPAAFPGWFRRIVIKHCDRVTRRRQLVLAPLDDSAQTEPGPEAIHIVRQEAQLLRFAVDALPAEERIVVALQYFAEATGPEVSTFLELPVSTIKRRLRRARRRLREEGEILMARTIDDMRPSQTGKFAREITFFIALRAGDHTEVRRLLDTDATLVEAQQDWDSSLVHEGVLPFASKATPLITAIERGDLPMLTLLLDAGADVNGMCGCVTGEAPIWAAALLNRVDHARLLLKRGADPNALSSSGNCALHLAAMRGLKEMASLLLERNADPGIVDAGAHPSAPWTPIDGSPTARGRTALEWAIANGHDEVAALIAGSTHDRSADLKSPTQGSEVEDTSTVIHTGIKALDLFAPVVRGGVIRFPFMAGVGMVVLLGELCQRFLTLDSGKAIWTGFTQPPFDLGDWEGDMAEFGLAGCIESRLVSFSESAETRREAFYQGLHRAETLRDSGHAVLAVILSTQGFENEIESSLMRLKTPSAQGSITSIIVTPFAEKRELWTQLKAPYSGQIALDRTRAQRHLFPAIDPQRSMSQGFDVDTVGERHVRLAEASQALIEEYQRLDPEFERLSDGLAGQPDKARQLLRFLSQPFSTTEPFTGRPGEYVDRETLLKDVAEIVQD